MRGSPLFRALIAFLAISLLGWPLWRLTHATDAVYSEEIAAPAQAVHLSLTFTLPPRGVKVRHLGKEVWAEASPTGEIEHDLTLPWPGEGIELQFLIDWPSDAPLAAARVRVTDPAGREHERSIFAQGPADEVLTFP
jgi:hypothetical protein